MTNAQKNIREIDKFLNQFADGWVFVGFNPRDGEPMTAVAFSDPKTAIALNSMLGGILSTGGVSAVQEALNQKQKDAGEDEATVDD